MKKENTIHSNILQSVTTKSEVSTLPNGYEVWRKEIITLIEQAKFKAALNSASGTCRNKRRWKRLCASNLHRLHGITDMYQCPLAELSGTDTIYTIANANNRIEIIMLRIVLLAISGSSSEIPTN